ncbi:hypothetical protein M153_42340001522, partial [Pseudoloma neurophilia]
PVLQKYYLFFKNITCSLKTLPVILKYHLFFKNITCYSTNYHIFF